MRHLLVTNDYPPKMGGIQSYLWELWRRLPAHEVTVLTTPHAGAEAWDRTQPYRIERTREPVLLPHPGLAARINRLAEEVDAQLVVLDPLLPLGLLAPALERPHAYVVHGAEVTLPGRLPISGAVAGALLRRARLVIAAGGYPLAEAEHAAGRALPSVVVPPGVDPSRFTPLGAAERRQARAGLGLPLDGPLVVSVSRLVPRKGMDVLIRAAARLAPTHPDLVVGIAGDGRDRGRLERLAAALGAPVIFLGRLSEGDLPRFVAAGDLFAMLCRQRWGGLEQEGFGIVFLEAAAAGLPSVAGRSGGSHEAVEHGVGGIVVDDPTDVDAVAAAVGALVDDPASRQQMGAAARARAERELSYDRLAATLQEALDSTATDPVATAAPAAGG